MPEQPPTGGSVSAVRIVVDHERCAGSGLCVLTEPAVFDQNDADGRVSLLDERPGPGSTTAVREAADLCPSRAIRVVDD